MAIFLALASSVACARDLARIDVLAAESRRDSASLQHRAGTAGMRVHVEERLAVPTFLDLAPGWRRPLPGQDAESRARAGLRSVASLYRARPDEIDRLRRIDLQLMPSGAQLLRFSHRIDGVEVFRERVSVLIDADAGLAAIGGYFVGDAAPSWPSPRFDAVAALGVALQDHGFDPAAVAEVATLADERDGYLWLRIGIAGSEGARMANPARVKRVWFRRADGLEAAHYVETQVADAASLPATYHAYVVSARNGEVLFRHRQSEDAAYRVWADSTLSHRPADGPTADFNPHPSASADGSRPPFVAPALISLLSGPIGTGDPWLSTTATESVGNNVDAYTDYPRPMVTASATCARRRRPRRPSITSTTPRSHRWRTSRRAAPP